MSAGALAGPASGSQPDREVPDAHHDPVRCPSPRQCGCSRIPGGWRWQDSSRDKGPAPSLRRFIVPGQGAGLAIAQVNDCGNPTARLPTRTISPGPSCSAGWTSCRCRPSGPPPTWAAERLASPPAPQLDLRARRAHTSTRRALKPPGLGRAVFPELPVAALCATLALQGGNRDRARRPSRIPSARWLRTFGPFRVGRAAATMTI